MEKKYTGPYVLSCKLDGISALYTTETQIQNQQEKIQQVGPKIYVIQLKKVVMLQTYQIGFLIVLNMQRVSYI